VNPNPEGIAMRTVVAPLVAGLLVPLSPPASAQDVMKYGLSHWTVLAENDEARVLRYAPEKGVKTPVHSHPSTVVYVVKGGRIRITMPDGSTQDRDLRSGSALVRAAETHSDEAIDDLEFILVELKK
jgi:quercetin dioxygenase-like cupin family protein